MKTPAFWDAPPDDLPLRARLLRPLGALYGAATALRMRRPGQRVAVPVICVGNLNAGGTGKTPTVIALAARLAARGVAAQVVSRGYGGELAGPEKVDPARHLAKEVGDEPLLIARAAPVWVARNRVAGAIAAIADGAEAIILDDGFQNPALVKDLSIVVADAGRGFGNGLCLPAGPLREPVSSGLRRADLLLSIGSEAAQDRFSQIWGATIRVPRLRGALAPVSAPDPWRGRRVVAFAGIGWPEKFFETLRGLGAEILETESFGDHQPIPPARLWALKDRARALDATLVTTEKDLLRLPEDLREGVSALPVALRIEDASALDAAFDRIGL